MEILQYMKVRAKSIESRRDIRIRQHLMERTFAGAVRYGFKRARWRRLWRVKIQEYITAAIQNIQILIKHGADPVRSVSVAKYRDRIDRYRTDIVHNTIDLFEIFTILRLRLKNREFSLEVQIC